MRQSNEHQSPGRHPTATKDLADNKFSSDEASSSICCFSFASCEQQMSFIDKTLVNFNGTECLLLNKFAEVVATRTVKHSAWEMRCRTNLKLARFIFHVARLLRLVDFLFAFHVSESFTSGFSAISSKRRIN